MAGLTGTQIVALTTSQIGALTTTQVSFLSPAHVNEMMNLTNGGGGTYTNGLVGGQTVTPLILDLNGDGVSTLGLSAGVQFDLAASGNKLQTGWVAGGDGLLVMDRNHDGLINDGRELFGSSTVLPGGEKATDGYAALRVLDSNKDELITGADRGFAELEVWIDHDADGISEAGEVKTLGDLGITQLDLHATASSATDNGNLLGLVSSYRTEDGAQHQMADVWFATQAPASAVTTMDTPPQADLRARVSSLAQAIAAFKDSPYTPADIPALSLLPSTETVGQKLAVSTSVGGIAALLKQYYANGNEMTVLAGTAMHTQNVLPGSPPEMPGSLTQNNQQVLAARGK